MPIETTIKCDKCGGVISPYENYYIVQKMGIAWDTEKTAWYYHISCFETKEGDRK